ncbi:MAG: TetR/AcrR family transcriptional regulator [Spirochaetales bacterium]|nr:TetR/AcrR family transcriptional regulator [Spirochaetales bacterium]
MRDKIIEKRQLLLKISLELFVKQGVYQTPMSQISRISNISMGSIYHYFKNKEDIINALYIDIKTNLTEYILKDYPDKNSIYESYLQLLNNVFHYFVQNPLELFFLEQYENSPMITTSTREEELRIVKPIEELFIQAKEQNMLKKLPPEILYALFIGSVTSLIKFHLSGDYELDENLLIASTSAIWDMIKQ